jgi:hypothetical protein
MSLYRHGFNFWPSHVASVLLPMALEAPVTTATLPANLPMYELPRVWPAICEPASVRHKAKETAVRHASDVNPSTQCRYFDSGNRTNGKADVVDRGVGAPFTTVLFHFRKDSCLVAHLVVLKTVLIANAKSIAPFTLSEWRHPLLRAFPQRASTSSGVFSQGPDSSWFSGLSCSIGQTDFQGGPDDVSLGTHSTDASSKAVHVQNVPGA